MISNMLILLLSFFATIQNKNVLALQSEDIINGILVKPGTFTYQVYLSTGCGGAIIGSNLIVTAAHCIFDAFGQFENPISVIAGQVDLKVYQSTKAIARVTKAYVPSDYPRTNIFPTPGDVAVLRVDYIFDFGKDTGYSYLELPPEHPQYSNLAREEAVITGFGIDSLQFKPYYDLKRNLIFKGYASKKMSWAKATILNETFCHIFLGHQYDHRVHLCAHSHLQVSLTDALPSSTCEGDSGGPLVYQGKYVVGILSSGPTDCDESNSASLYTSIIAYRTFLEKAIDDVCDEEYMFCNTYGYQAPPKVC